MVIEDICKIGTFTLSLEIALRGKLSGILITLCYNKNSAYWESEQAVSGGKQECKDFSLDRESDSWEIVQILTMVVSNWINVSHKPLRWTSFKDCFFIGVLPDYISKELVGTFLSCVDDTFIFNSKWANGELIK